MFILFRHFMFVFFACPYFFIHRAFLMIGVISDASKIKIAEWSRYFALCDRKMTYMHMKVQHISKCGAHKLYRLMFRERVHISAIPRIHIYRRYSCKKPLWARARAFTAYLGVL